MFDWWLVGSCLIDSDCEFDWFDLFDWFGFDLYLIEKMMIFLVFDSDSDFD